MSFLFLPFETLKTIPHNPRSRWCLRSPSFRCVDVMVPLGGGNRLRTPLDEETLRRSLPSPLEQDRVESLRVTSDKILELFIHPQTVTRKFLHFSFFVL